MSEFTDGCKRFEAKWLKPSTNSSAATEEQIQFCPHGCIGECVYMRAGRDDKHECCPYDRAPAPVADIKPKAATVETPRTDEFQARIASSGSTHGAYELCLDHARQLERSLAAKTAELEEAKALQKGQLDIVAGCGPITCRNGKQHERHDGCMYCDLAASQQRCGRLEAIIEKIAAAFDRWKYGQCSDVDFHDIVKRTLTKEPR